MADLETIISRIKQNCDISDAKYWGSYSICGLLLRLRELFRIEKGIKPWEHIPQKEISEWISERENLWHQLEGKNFVDITVNGNVYSPFYVKEINEAFEKEGLVYGAGYGIHMKPSFFLADLISKKTIAGYDIHTAGNEYVRDLSAYPAMLQNGEIFARVDATRQLLWGRFEELRFRKLRGALAFAFSHYGIAPEEEPSEDIDRLIFQAAVSEVETYIYHELGEAFEGERLGEDWRAMLTELSCKAEFFARGIKDLISDTSENGMIRYIIENRKEGSLGFYIVFLGSYRRVLFPEMVEAFKKFVEAGDWELVDDTRKTGYKKAKLYAEKLLTFYRNKTSRKNISEYIENEMIRGLF